MDRLMARLNGDDDPRTRYAVTVEGESAAGGDGGGEDTLDSDVAKALKGEQDEGSDTGGGEEASVEAKPSDTGKTPAEDQEKIASAAKIEELQRALGSKTEESQRLLGAIKKMTGGDRPTDEQKTVRQRIVAQVVKQAKDLKDDPERATKIYEQIFGGVEDVARDVVRSEMDRVKAEKDAYDTAKTKMCKALDEAGLPSDKFHPMAERIAKAIMHTDPEWFVRTPGPDQFTAIVEEIQSYVGAARGSKTITDANEKKRKEMGGTVPAGSKKPAGTAEGEGEDDPAMMSAVGALAQIKKDARDRSKNLIKAGASRGA